MRGLAGKTFIVAGGATGVGAGAAARLGEEGANVVVGDINVQGAHVTANRSPRPAALPLRSSSTSPTTTPCST